MRSEATMRVLVVGGGIGGLTAAIALGRAGHAVRVIERSPRFAPVGAGIIAAPNAARILEVLGVDLAAHGRVLDAMEIRRWDGRVLSKIELGPLRARLGPSYALARPALHDALAAALPPAVELSLGATVEAIAADADGVTVGLSGGEEARFDLLIGADGIHSQVRALTVGAVPLRYSGVTCWRGICANPGIDRAIEAWGGRERVGLVPLRGGDLYVFLVRSEEARAPSLAWPAGFEAAFGRFAAPVPEALRALDGAALLHHDLEELEAPCWGAGRVLLLGDAAHALTPNQGQGAAMAIEDAAALALALGPGIAGADARYVETRRARVRRVQLDSRRLGAVAQWPGPLAAGLRDWLVRLTPRSATDGHFERLVSPGIELAGRLGPGGRGAASAA